MKEGSLTSVSAAAVAPEAPDANNDSSAATRARNVATSSSMSPGRLFVLASQFLSALRR